MRITNRSKKVTLLIVWGCPRIMSAEEVRWSFPIYCHLLKAMRGWKVVANLSASIITNTNINIKNLLLLPLLLLLILNLLLLLLLQLLLQLYCMGMDYGAHRI